MALVIGLLIPFFGTMLGAAFVFLMKDEMSPRLQKSLLGFASGVMVAAVLFIGLGGSLAYNNHQHCTQYAEQYRELPQMFLESEKARVVDFMKIYPQTIIVSAVMIAVAICLFAFCYKPWLRASALVLILIALAALSIDYFSKERGAIYQQELDSVQIEMALPE